MIPSHCEFEHHRTGQMLIERATDETGIGYLFCILIHSSSHSSYTHLDSLFLYFLLLFPLYLVHWAECTMTCSTQSRRPKHAEGGSACDAARRAALL